MPKVDIASLPEDDACDYPAPFHEIAKGRVRRRLGDAGGLTQFGVNLCRLEPGSGSSQRHWHESEDEFVYVLEGEVVLVEDEGETILKPGDAATFKAGVANGHQLINRSDRDALFLEVGTRTSVSAAHYSDLDMKVARVKGVDTFMRKDGTPYPQR